MAWLASSIGLSNLSLAGAQSGNKVLTEGCEVTIQGEVKGRVERPANLKDGDRVLKVSTADYGMVNVVYSSFRLCHNAVGTSVKEGDQIEVYGKVITKNRITVCLSKDYYIKKL